MATNDANDQLTTKRKVVKLANELLQLCQKDKSNQETPTKINTYKEINSNLFVYFYETICNTELVDKKWPANGIEDEIHNVQSVIDSLSMDVLHEDLSHLTGEAICGYNKNKIKYKKPKPDLISIEYLLDILRSIYDWVTSKVDNKTNTTTNITPLPEENVNKYESLSRQIEETIELTKNVLNLRETEYDSNDLFRSYMSEKEREFKNRSYNHIVRNNEPDRQVEELKICKSSSGNSSLSGSTNSLSSKIPIEEPSRHVKFNIKKEHESARKSRSPVIAKRERSNVQTVDNEFDLIRASLDENKISKQSKISNLLKNIYDEDLRDANSIHRLNLNKIANRSDLTNQLFMSAHSRDVKAPIKTRPSLIPSSSSRSKGVLLPKSKSLTTVRRSVSVMSDCNGDDDLVDLLNSHRTTARSSSALGRRDPAKQFMSRITVGEDGILSTLLQEFPYLYTSPETIHYLWQKHAKHIETLTKAQKEIEAKYSNNQNSDVGGISARSDSKVEVHLKEAYRKQQMFMDIMRKELAHMQRIQDLKRKQQVENSLKAKMREQRFTSVKVKKYYEEFRLEQRAKMLKQTTSEELIFKRLFNKSLKLQKERILELKKYAKEKNELNSKNQLNQMESIENYYKTKFDLLNERMRKEKDSALIREKAQHLVLTKMKRQAKNKMENDIRDLQEQMYRDKDFLYWRQTDANRVCNEINYASYFKQNTAN
jgi:centrosomal protein CEP95